MDNICICPKCGAINNHGFVMYYGDECFNCNFDIKTYINNGLYNNEELERKFNILKEEIIMKRVIVESPYMGNHEMNEAYAEFAMHDCLVNHNESPYASHLLYTRRFVLNDNIESERNLGIKAGFLWREVADKTIFYTDLGMTEGMKKGIRDCMTTGKSYEIRILPDDLWKKFEDYCFGQKYSVERK